MKRTVMECSLATAIAMMSLAISVSPAHSRTLVPVKRIGMPWRLDKPGWMSFVAFNADGTMVASDGPAARGDVSGNLTLWSFPKGRLIRRFNIQVAVLSDDWTYLANSRGVWNVRNGTRIISEKPDSADIFAFSPDNRFLAEVPVAHGAPAIRIRTLADARQTGAFGTEHPVALAIGPDGKTLAAGYWNMVTLWNVSTGRRLAALHGFGRYVESLSFNKDGKLLAAGDDLGTLQVWDVRRRKRLWSVNLQGGDVSKPVFSPDGSLVAVGVYGTGTAWLLDAADGKIVDHQKISDLGCGAVAFSPDGRYLIAPSTGGLVTWPYDVGGTIRVFRVERH